MTHAAPRLPDPAARALEDRLSHERLKPYRAAVGGDLDLAIGLYEWNSAAGGAFFETLGHFEVLLRNALHDQLSAWHTAAGRPRHWYDDPAGVLDARRHADVAAARDRIRRERKTETPGKVVAELNFGFWRFLLDRRYQTMLWAPALRRAFPHCNPSGATSSTPPSMSSTGCATASPTMSRSTLATSATATTTYSASPDSSTPPRKPGSPR